MHILLTFTEAKQICCLKARTTFKKQRIAFTFIPPCVLLITDEIMNSCICSDQRSVQPCNFRLSWKLPCVRDSRQKSTELFLSSCGLIEVGWRVLSAAACILLTHTLFMAGVLPLSSCNRKTDYRKDIFYLLQR